MKHKAEKAFIASAYRDVPDRWDAVQEKLRDVVPELSAEKVVRVGVRSIASVAASVAIVVVAVLVAVGVGGRRSAPEADTTGVHASDPGGTAGGSVDAPETTIITYTDSDGVEHTAIATVTRNASGQKEDSVVVTFKDAEGNTQTTVVEIPAEPSPTKPSSSDSAQQAADATAAATTRAEVYEETDWDRRTMQGKFPAVQFDPAGGLGKEYSAAFRGTGYISRPATLLYSGYTLRNVNPKTDKEETTTADIYVFQGFDRALAVGVKFPGEEHIHPYVNMHYTPQTLGEFLNAADVRSAVHFGNIRLFRDGTFPVNAQNKADIFEYLLSDGSIKNTNATDRPTGNKVTLSIDLAELGQRNKVMDVYESGYVYTNMLGYGCCFNVGKQNVAAFLQNSYNVTFDDLAKVNTAVPGTASDSTTGIAHDPTVSQPYIPGTTVAVTSAPQTISE